MLKGIFPSVDISASGLSVQRARMNVISGNIANINTTRTDGKAAVPYKRKRAVMTSMQGSGEFQVMMRQADVGLRTTQDRHISLKNGMGASERERIPGVAIQEVLEDKTPPRMIYDPIHPDANTDGYVAMPDINIVVEMVDMISATRAYEANITAINAAKSMAKQALDI